MEYILALVVIFILFCVWVFSPSLAQGETEECKKGNHRWGPWKAGYAYILQRRKCKDCNFMQEKVI